MIFSQPKQEGDGGLRLGPLRLSASEIGHQSSGCRPVTAYAGLAPRSPRGRRTARSSGRAASRRPRLAPCGQTGPSASRTSARAARPSPRRPGPTRFAMNVRSGCARPPPPCARAPTATPSHLGWNAGRTRSGTAQGRAAPDRGPPRRGARGRPSFSRSPEVRIAVDHLGAGRPPRAAWNSRASVASVLDAGLQDLHRRVLGSDLLGQPQPALQQAGGGPTHARGGLRTHPGQQVRELVEHQGQRGRSHLERVGRGRRREAHGRMNRG